MMIAVSHDDSRDTTGINKFVQCLAPQRNRIDKIAAIGRDETGRIKLRFDSGIVVMPNRDIRSDSVEI